jgi:hypothetical protein
VARKTGYHGRITIAACRSCHTDHKGRDARIAQFDPRTFDHTQNDYLLRGKHANAACSGCHKSGARYNAAPSACVECHRKDDTHRGSLGAACADCHSEKSWKEATFDHARTRFALTGKHADVQCRSCHRNTSFKETPQQCVACHRRDDKHKARYGEKCETCHTTKAWRDITFDHGTTRYALRGGHARAKCDACHTGVLYRDRLDTRCLSCHRKDDKHKGQLGPACGDCHSEQGWKDTRFDHDRTRFPLTGKHASVRCAACHGTRPAAQAPSACNACHAKDDKHKGVFADQCQTCHGTDTWKTSRFDHARDTRYPLRGRHAEAACETCHVQPVKRVKLGQACPDCHARDDVHQGQQGPRCEQCHQESSWRKVAFDHARARFPLVGAHLKVACNQCHASARYKDAKSECAACHARKDVHEGRFGKRCDACHSARAWQAWDFDHDRNTRFALDGGHRGVRCAACHAQPITGTDKQPRPCAACHAADDVHDGAFSSQCARCHVSSSFKTILPPARRQ